MVLRTGSGSDWGFSSRLSLPPRKRPALHGRPPAGLVQSEPSPALNGPEGGTRRLCRRLRFCVGKATPRFVAGTACLPVAHGLVRLSWPEGSPAGLAPTQSGVRSGRTHGVRAVVGANPVGDSRRSGEAADCSAHQPPQCRGEPAGSPLGACRSDPWSRTLRVTMANEAMHGIGPAVGATERVLASYAGTARLMGSKPHSPWNR